MRNGLRISGSLFQQVIDMFVGIPIRKNANSKARMQKSPLLESSETNAARLLLFEFFAGGTNENTIQ